MLNVLANRAKSLSTDCRQGDRLRLVPILGPSHEEPPYELLRTQTLPLVKITEISDSGSVPSLLVTNELEVRIFLMDGQELVGAKQNRILNTDVLVPAKGSLTIPVSCVEAGRWRHTSETFSGGKSASHRIRSSKMLRVHQSLKTDQTHDADQEAVWEEVSASMRTSRTSSPTSALSDAYAQREADLRTFRSTLKLPEQAVGLAAFSGGQFQGLDLFDRHSTLQFFWESLLDSYALEQLYTGVESVPSVDVLEEKIVRDVLDGAAAAQGWEAFASPGEGRDWRLQDKTVSGSALVWEETVVHLQLFPRQPETPEDGGEQPRRPRMRRRYGPQ